MSEETSKLLWAGVERDAFCPEDCAAADVVGHVFQDLVAISRGWICEIVRRDDHADGGGFCRNELVVVDRRD